MKTVTVLGCGPVGLATMVLLKRAGHHINAIDPNPSLIAKCRSQVFDKLDGLSHELTAQFEDRYHRDFISDTVFFCIGTPFVSEKLCMENTFSAIESLAKAEALDKINHVVFRSTFSPGSCEDILIPRIQKEWKKEVSVSYFPEFLREKFIAEDLKNPPLSVVAHNSEKAETLFKELKLSVKSTSSIRMLELLKLSCNAFHALKVAFANEMGTLAKQLNVQSHEMMNLFCEDEKLNISPNYLRPGAPFGGACLDKDLLAIEHLAHSRQISIPLLKSIRESNEFQKKFLK